MVLRAFPEGLTLCHTRHGRARPGHLQRHVLEQMAGSGAGHDGETAVCHSFRRLVSYR